MTAKVNGLLLKDRVTEPLVTTVKRSEVFPEKTEENRVVFDRMF